eukprot:489177-Prymnesium_polylepis.2
MIRSTPEPTGAAVRKQRPKPHGAVRRHARPRAPRLRATVRFSGLLRVRAAALRACGSARRGGGAGKRIAIGVRSYRVKLYL